MQDATVLCEDSERKVVSRESRKASKILKLKIKQIRDEITERITTEGNGTFPTVSKAKVKVKVKVKLSPCLSKYHAMKKYGGSGGVDPCFLNSALDIYEWSDSRPAALPRDKSPGNHCI
jgi:hypothetical protein